MTEDGLIGQGNLGLGLTRPEIDQILESLQPEAGNLFEDPEFPVEPSALFYRSMKLFSVYFGFFTMATKVKVGQSRVNMG
jgi:hypothetical protein